MVIPAFQAEATIGPLVDAILAQGLPVMVVDDASSDATTQEALARGIYLIRRSTNGGKGAALREGFSEALQKGFDWVLTLDADGQHLPSEIPRFLELKGSLDLVIGNRMTDPKGMPWERRWTNRWMSRFLSRVAGQMIPDTQCGFRLIWRPVLERVRLASERFEIDSELVVRTAWAGFRIGSVPISSVYRRRLSFIRPLRDTVRFFRLLRFLRRERPG